MSNLRVLCSAGALAPATLVCRPAFAAGTEAVAVGPALLQTIIALIGVCALAALTLRLGASRFGGPAGAGSLRVIARLPLEPKRSLLVVRVGERTMMLASSEAGVVSVGELDARDALALEEPNRTDVSRETSAAIS